jgi:hypothetical protein
LTGVTGEQGDADGDGDVDMSDFAILAIQFGAGSPVAEDLAQIPEPGTLAPGLLVAVMLMFTRILHARTDEKFVPN